MNKPVMKSENRKQNHRKTVLLCLLILMLAVGGIAGMKAYFTDMESISNNFTVGEVVCEITDDKTVIVKNTGSVDCYIRVFAEPERPEMTLTATYNTEDWTEKQSDGYYYYETSVTPGDVTASLLIDPEYSEDAAYIVYAEAVQAKGFDSAIDAFKAN